MEVSQDRRISKRDFKKMSPQSIIADGEAKSESLRKLSFKRNNKKKLERLGSTSYKELSPQPSKVKNWNTSKNGNHRVSANVGNESASSDEMNLKPNDVAVDNYLAEIPPSSSVINSQSSSSIASSSDEKRSPHKANPVAISKPAVCHLKDDRQSAGITVKGKARQKEGKAQPSNLTMNNHSKTRAIDTKVKGLPLLDKLNEWDNVSGKLGSKATRRKPQPFPMDNFASKVERHGTTRTIGQIYAFEESSQDEELETPVRSLNRDKMVTRGGLRPFPMSSQDRDSSCSNRPPSSSKRESETEDETNVVKRRRRSSSISLQPQLLGVDVTSSMNDISLVDTSSDDSGSTKKKGKSLCPYCDMPLPADPSPTLQRMLKDIKGSRLDPRPSNPAGRKAPLLSYINMCQRHQFEVELLPQAEAAGWPTRIEFNKLPSRIRSMRNRLKQLIEHQSESSFWTAEVERQLGFGSRKASSIAGQLSAFEKCQPGYYGEQGFVIMYRTISVIFPPETMDLKHIEPLSPSDFTQRVLVPECALALIQEDSGPGTSAKDALRIMQASSKFGTAMYPDMDTSGSAKDASAEASGHGIGDAMLKDQAQKNASTARAEQARSSKNAPKVKARGERREKTSRAHNSPSNSSTATKYPRRYGARQSPVSDCLEESDQETARRRTHSRNLSNGNTRDGRSERLAVPNVSADDSDSKRAKQDSQSQSTPNGNNYDSWLLYDSD